MSNRQRIGSAGTNRAASASNENKMLRDTVNRLHQELLQSKAETQRISEQLSCMMLLVKKAWQGDQKAAVNVANIVGVAPPDYEEANSGVFTVVTTTPKEPNGSPISIVMKNKSKALNNWALLTIGLLNREYKAQEERLEARQHYYMNQRMAFLDEQLLYHRDLQAKVAAEMTREAQIAQQDKQRQIQQSIATNQMNVYEMIARNNQNQQHQLQQQNQNPPHGVGSGGSLLKRSNSYSDVSTRRIKSASHAERSDSHTFMTQPSVNQPGPFTRPQSSKPSAKKPLYRPANQQQESKMKWADLMIDPSRNKIGQNGPSENETEKSVYKMANTKPEVRYDLHRGQMLQRRTSYDDPVRYNVQGLFEVDNALGPGSTAFRQRPISAKAQRESDAARARPRSAIIGQGERAMKYEVIRPASAAVHGKGTQKSSLKSGTSSHRRPPSGKRAQSTTSQNQQAPDRYHPNSPINGHNGSMNGLNDYANTSGTSDLHNDVTAENDETQWDSDDSETLSPMNPETFKRLGIDLKELERAERMPVMKVDIKKPQSVIDYEHDVDDMHTMEKEIRKNALALQKKLGISAEGMI